MDRRTFDRYIETGDFRGLFIGEMGWNKCKGRAELPPITIDETTYCFRVVADKQGFQVVVAEVGAIPATAVVRRIDAQLRKLANDYIAIYTSSTAPTHHLWIVPVKNVDKRDLVSVEYENANQAGFLFSKLNDFTFDLGEELTIVDVKAAVHRAFFVNSEKVTKDFYNGFKKIHNAFVTFIQGIDDEIPDGKNENKQWYASVMLNRLMFCYFIQKKGFLNNDYDYLGKKLAWCKRRRGENQFFSTFYRGFLTHLFSDGLNLPLQKRFRDFQSQYGRIPYLNGGMFDRHILERDYLEIDVKDEAFEKLFEFFDKWQWHLDTRITASGKDINPDVLGYIFEQYINDRAAMGAYYTKEDITEYIGRNTILPFLLDKVLGGESLLKSKKYPFIAEVLSTSKDRYVFDAVKHGYIPEWRDKIPKNISVGLLRHDEMDEAQLPVTESNLNLLERRKDWNTRTPEQWGLPTEIWRETIERLQRCEEILGKIERGEINSINDFITYNLDIRQFASDLINSEKASQGFIYSLYDALRTVTVLDPTCGSGAFLFAALNILEPLYYDCIVRLEAVPQNQRMPLVIKALEEIHDKYRSNIHYFIYKSIILRNLYGVDIMAEATEIAKLRLFLKMVAVVDVDYRAANLGLDPLPDIDFNIRCGNTLVGYANAESIWNDHAGNIFAAQEYCDKVGIEMELVAREFKVFKALQLTQEIEHHQEFIESKQRLGNRLSALNDVLNRHLHDATTSKTPYEEWLRTHQPFNWVAEFYDIINGNGGFDIIIGNPPYVEYFKRNSSTKKSLSEVYTIVGYETITCGNLYAYVLERCGALSQSSSCQGFIIPSASVCTPRMELLCKLLQRGTLWTSIWDERPAKLFDGVDQQLCIQIYNHKKNGKANITRMNHWHAECRELLFKTLSYFDYDTKLRVSDVIPKIQNKIELRILSKLYTQSSPIIYYTKPATETSAIFYKNAGGRYWRLIKSFPTFYQSNKGSTTSTEKSVYVSKNMKEVVICALSSSLFYWFWRVVSNCRHLTNRELEGFRLSKAWSSMSEVIKPLWENFEKDLNNNKRRSITQNKTNGEIQQDFFYVKQSKEMIDKMDQILSQLYGFTEEELDFIINYDIKYRMGDELNADDEG